MESVRVNAAGLLTTHRTLPLPHFTIPPLPPTTTISLFQLSLHPLRMQSDNMMSAIAAGLLFNTGVLLSAVSPSGPPLMARAMIWAGVIATAKWVAGQLAIKKLDKKLVSVGSAVGGK